MPIEITVYDNGLGLTLKRRPSKHGDVYLSLYRPRIGQKPGLFQLYGTHVRVVGLEIV